MLTCVFRDSWKTTTSWLRSFSVSFSSSTKVLTTGGSSSGWLLDATSFKDSFSNCKSSTVSSWIGICLSCLETVAKNVKNNIFESYERRKYQIIVEIRNFNASFAVTRNTGIQYLVRAPVFHKCFNFFLY